MLIRVSETTISTLYTFEHFSKSIDRNCRKFNIIAKTLYFTHQSLVHVSEQRRAQ